MEPFDATFRFLAEVRRELGRVARGEVVFAALVALAAAVVLGFGVAFMAGAGPGRWGWVPLGLGAALVGVIVWRLGVRPARARSNDAALALWVERSVPGLESGLVTTVETAPLVRARAAETHGFSPALATATAERTAERTRRIDARRLPDRTRLKRLAWAAAGGVATLGLLAILWPDFYARGATQLVAAPPDESADGRLVDVAVSQLDLEIRAPKYTHLEPRRVAHTSGDIEALKGSEVGFSGTVLYPATGAALVLESDPESRWMLDLAADGTVKGQLQVGADDRYQFVLVDPDGDLVRERVWRKVTMKEDRAPEVTMLLPESDLEVKTEGEVSFFFEASDDLGLEKVELVVKGDDDKELVRRVVSAATGETLVKDDATVEIAKLGLEPGQSAEVWFEATDRNDVGGPGLGKSAVRRISIYSPADEHDQILSDLRQLIEKMLDVLADRLESPVDHTRPDLVSRFAEAHAAMLGQTVALLGEIDRLAGLLTTDPLATDALRDGLRSVRESISGVHEQERAHLAKWDESPDLVEPRVWVTLLEQTNSEAVTVLEQGILKLKNLIDGALKDAILEAGREMLETQNEMMELLKELKDKNDPAAREAALKKLQKLQQKLKELQQKLAKLQERTPYENQNPAQRPSENQQEAKDLQGQMDEIQKLLEEGKIDEAMKKLEELSKSTQQMMAGLQDDLESIGGGGGQAAMQKMAEMKQELDQLADGQRGLQGETGRVDDQIDGRQAKELADKAQAQLEDMKGEAKKIREALGKANNGGLHPDDKQALDKLEQAAAELEQQIENARAGEAQKKAGDVSQGSDALGQEVGESEAREMERERLEQLRDAMKNLKDASERAKGLADKLEGMKPKPGEGLTPGEGQQLGQLGKQQGDLEQKLRQLQDKMKETGKDNPELEDAMKDALEQAGKSMGEAKGELDQKRPKGARQKQQEALEKLQEAQQQLEEKMEQQRQQQGNGEEMTGINDGKEKVEIPKDDPYASPRDLREEILKAMGERAPDAYKDAIRKFYEELTK